jgi:hypothetical protein
VKYRGHGTRVVSNRTTRGSDDGGGGPRAAGDPGTGPDLDATGDGEGPRTRRARRALGIAGALLLAGAFGAVAAGLPASSLDLAGAVLTALAGATYVLAGRRVPPGPLDRRGLYHVGLALFGVGVALVALTLPPFAPENLASNVVFVGAFLVVAGINVAVVAAGLLGARGRDG